MRYGKETSYETRSIAKNRVLFPSGLFFSRAGENLESANSQSGLETAMLIGFFSYYKEAELVY